ncbi:MAG: MFS transporter [Opitutaceae bacterium]|nr:MFS transporter [Opitutaceae bacterium]
MGFRSSEPAIDRRVTHFSMFGSQTPSSPEAYGALIERDFRRNLSAFAGWEFLWGLGVPFALTTTFAPAYLDALQSPTVLIALVLTFPSLFSSFQLIVNYHTSSSRRLRVFGYSQMGSMLPWLAYSALSFVCGEYWPAPVHWLLFTLCLAVFNAMQCGPSSLYWEIMTDNTPKLRRGLLIGWRAAGFGGAGLSMGYFAGRVMSHWGTPQNFRVSFLVGTILYFLSCFMLLRVRDHINPAHNRQMGDDQPPWREYVLRTVHELWSNPNYRIFFFFYTLLMVCITTAPFMVAAAKGGLGATAQQQGFFGLVYLGTIASLGWAIGLLADRFGYRLIGCICSILLAGAFLICLFSRSIYLWYLAFAAYATCSFSAPALLSYMSAELCPHVPLGRLLAVGNVLIVAFVLLASLIAGAVVDSTGSYAPVFLANFVISVVAIFGFIFIVREPRSGQLYIIKTIPKG